jgi:hypothetical protein
MKRFFSAGLLVSILVVIQAFAGCAGGPQTVGGSQAGAQKIITITGISPEFNGKYATVGIEENNAAIAASLPIQISGGSVTVELLDAAAGNPPFTKNGSYSVGVLIFDSNAISAGNIIWRGGTKADINASPATIPFSSLQRVN